MNKIKTKMRMEIMEVTPELASKWLTKNEGNRKLRPARAGAWARAILADKWELTHQGIAFSESGRLIDGQHRLEAVRVANKPIVTTVFFDVPERGFTVMDAGLPRQMYERLRKDRRHISVCSTLFRLLQTNRVPQAHESELLIETLGPALLKMDLVSRPTSAKNVIKAAPYEAAIALRMAEAMRDKDDDRILRINFHLEHLRKGEVSILPPIMQAFYRQMYEGVQSEIGVSPVTDKFVRTWVAFDPNKEETSKLQINDHRAAVMDAQQAFIDVTDGIFD